MLAHVAASFLPLVNHLGWTRHLPVRLVHRGNPLGNAFNARYIALLLATAVGAIYLAARVLDRSRFNT